jgi:opacity protein-like surface antigen
MKRLLMVMCLLLLFTASKATAQEIPKAELFGGYSYAGGNFHGWNASVTGNVNGWLGLTADFSGHYGGSTEGDIFTEKQRANSYLFGPRVSFRKRKRVSPFVYALFGVSRLSVRETFMGQTFAASDSGFGTAIGGGLDIRLNKRLALRAFQLDYLRTNFFDETGHRGRLAFGLVLRLGQK